MRKFIAAILFVIAALLAMGLSKSTRARMERQAATSEKQAAWDKLADEYFDDVYFKFAPSSGTAAGLHQYDALLEDYSRAGVDANVAALRSFEKRVEAMAPTGLDETRAADRNSWCCPLPPTHPSRRLCAPRPARGHHPFGRGKTDIQILTRAVPSPRICVPHHVRNFLRVRRAPLTIDGGARGKNASVARARAMCNANDESAADLHRDCHLSTSTAHSSTCFRTEQANPGASSLFCRGTVIMLEECHAPTLLRVWRLLIGKVVLVVIPPSFTHTHRLAAAACLPAEVDVLVRGRVGVGM